MYESAFFLFTLGIFGNYVGDTIGCQLQKAFSHTVVHKYMIIFAMIYFTLNFTSKEIQSPITHLQTSLLLFMFYIFINRMNYTFSMISLGLLALLYIINHQIEYLKSIKNDTPQHTKELQMYQTIHQGLTYGVITLILIGFSLYFIKQKREHKAFSLSTFIFGKVKCDNV